MKKVLIAFDIQEKEKAAFQEAVDRTGRDCELVFTPPAEVTAEQIQQANFILGNVPPQMIGASEKLDVLQVFTAGTDGYAVEGVLADKTVLCNGTGAYGLAVSEHAFALTMMLIKKLHLYRSNQMKCRWQDQGLITSLTESTVLIVGLGDIGLAYARLTKAMGAKVIGVKRRSGPCPEDVDELVMTEDIDRVLPQADVIMSILPNTEKTVHFYTEERFQKMKDSAVFINVGRGNAVAEDVLLKALRTGEIAAAAIDVCEAEPLPADSPLWKEEKLVITPHVAGYLHHWSIYETIIEIATENITNYLLDKPLRNIVDRSTGYKK